MQVVHRVAVSVLALLVVLVAAVPAKAAPLQQEEAAITAWFGSEQATVAPLEPTRVNVSVTGYTGPASLVIFDSTGRSMGGWDFTIPEGGNVALTVLPRGAMGDHWAALFISGENIKSGTIYRLEAHTTVRTGVDAYDDLYTRVRGFMQNCTMGYRFNGEYVYGYRSPDSPLLWLRDHYYQGRGFRYFDSDVKSLLEAFRHEQQLDGSLPDFLGRPDLGIPSLRTPVEADVEYLYALAVYEAWKVSGDDAWLVDMLPSVKKALAYSMSDPIRWEPTVALVKRPYTIDTWDFEYGPTTTDPRTGNPAPRHWIDDQTRWGIFHGDNTGLAYALRSLAIIEDYLGHPEEAETYRQQADGIMVRLNHLSWNGSFFTHHVKLNGWDVPGVDEDRQLSLSNAYALNRHVLTTDQARAIINEYRSRLQRPDNTAFAEWWSIDPPFPESSFGMAGRLGEQPGYYVNGGIMPLVGGELSRGAFRSGYEQYGFDVLQRYYDLIRRTGATYLWYHPTGGPGAMGEDVLPTDGWGSSAMLAALMEGAAGIEDNSILYHDVTLSPRWPASDAVSPHLLGTTVTNDTPGAPDHEVNNAYVVARYAASGAYLAYRWQQFVENNRTFLRLDVTGTGATVHPRLLMPSNTKEVNRVKLNGQAVSFRMEVVGSSRYIVLPALQNGIVHIEAELSM